MKVENYVDADFNSFANTTRLKRQDTTISKKVHDRILRDARKALQGYGIDFSQYGEPKATFTYGVICQVKWVHLESGNELELCEIRWDRKTGEIIQMGINGGVLTL